MSKKKATMTLKDFHGGCIPSDLPLPSAPGVTRGGLDQQPTWGYSVGRTDHRLRPASAGSARNLDEKTPFLSHGLHIGRNFDEDERKPLDGVSGPRRTVGDEIIHSQSSFVKEQKIDNRSGSRVGGRPASVPVPQTSSFYGSYAGRVGESHSTRLDNQTVVGGHGYGLNYPVVGGNTAQVVAGPYPNAWGVRKETASPRDRVSAAWSAPDAATKLAHASALEKVSSGRWSLKQPVYTLKDSGTIGLPETEGELMYGSNNSFGKRAYNRLDVANNPDPSSDVLAMHAERSLAVDDGIHAGGKEMPTYERAKSTVGREQPYMRHSSISVNGVQTFQPIGKSGGSELMSPLPAELSERPKLKLLPRSKPLENMETTADYKQGLEQKTEFVEDNYVAPQPRNHAQTGLAGSADGDRAPERPKLNLKPRTQPLEQSEGNDENKRGMVFGGARPREVVLKARGIDEDVSHYESQSPLRIKEGVPKVDTFTHVSTASYPERPDSIPTDQKIAKYPDRVDHHHDGERVDTMRKNRQNEIRKNNRDLEKHHNQQQSKQLQDRPPSPETWRKPVEQSTREAPPARYGKAASALELAQAFSKSVSNPTLSDRLSGPRGVPNRGQQVPFSRLVRPTPRPQINGY